MLKRGLMMVLNRENHSELWKYLVVFGLLFLSTSFVVTNDIVSNGITIMLWLLLITICIWKSSAKIDNRAFLTGICLSFILIITNVLAGMGIIIAIKIVVIVVGAMLTVSALSISEFCHSYVKVVRLLCIASLIGWILHFIVPDLFNNFIVINSVGKQFSNWGLYVQAAGKGYSLIRNQGMMWEPGAFATFIALAMLFEVYQKKNEMEFKYIALYLATSLSTFSTTGIVAVLLLCLYLVLASNQDRSLKRKIIIVCLIAVIVLLPFQSLFFDQNTNSTFGKILGYINNSDSGKISSTSIRVNAITKCFQAFIEKPIMGWGFDGLRNRTYEYTFGMNTCTFINYFAAYGIFFGFIVITGLWRFSKKLSSKGMDALFIIVFFFIITSTENYVHNALFFAISFYGYSQLYLED